ncbi:hypothetical protein G7046_g5980 [Stylonectria norvegica]|nr:hypothetical protein G7046_g5980 [Stylonectria norvegica]
MPVWKHRPSGLLRSYSYVQRLLATIKEKEQELNGRSTTSPPPRNDGNGSNDGDSPMDHDTPSKPSARATSKLEKSPSPAEMAPGPAFESRVISLLRDHAEGSRPSEPSPNSSSLESGTSTERHGSQWRAATELLHGMSSPTLLSKTRSYNLFNVFVSFMGINQHFLDPRTFSDSLTLLYQTEATQARQIQTMWFTQYLLVMAMGMLIGSPSEGAANPPGTAYFAEAIKRLPPMHELGSHGVTSVEILCLITLYLQWCDRKHDAYLYIGAAIRLAIALGCPLPYDEQQGLPSEICHRVRVWWTAYMLDRRLSAGLGLPVAADDRQLRADLPRASAGFEPPLPLIINVRITRATGEIMTSFYGNTAISQTELVQQVQKTLTTLSETGRSIPGTLAVDFIEVDMTVSRTSASLYLMLFQAIILCIRPIILQSVKDKVQFSKPDRQPPPVAPVIARLCHSCQEAASKSIKILSSLQKQKTIALFGFFDLDATFSAAFILMMMGFVKSNDPQKPPDGLKEAAGILRYLSDAGNKSAEQRLADLKQLCHHVWSPDKMLDEWQWLGDKEPETTGDVPRQASDADVNITGMDGAGRPQVDSLTQDPSLHSFWPEEWDGWFNTSVDVAGAIPAFDNGADFELDLNHEADEIYTSFNDPNLPLTGVDQMDWAEMEKIFQIKVNKLGPGPTPNFTTLQHLAFVPLRDVLASWSTLQITGSRRFLRILSCKAKRRRTMPLIECGNLSFQFILNLLACPRIWALVPLKARSPFIGKGSLDDKHMLLDAAWRLVFANPSLYIEQHDHLKSRPALGGPLFYHERKDGLLLSAAVAIRKASCIDAPMTEREQHEDVYFLQYQTAKSKQQPAKSKTSLYLHRPLVTSMRFTIALLLGGLTGTLAVTTTLPKSSGVTSASTAIPVATSYDGGMKRFERNPKVCEEQTETGEAEAMFILEAGATLSNVIIGSTQAEGVHCRGTCTLNNVWWSDVCEDAATFKQTSGTSYVNGGGAFKAADKIFQFNGRGTLQVKGFYANDYGKLVRSCGNCSGNGGPRNIIIADSVAVDGGVLCGINTNYGDTCKITNSCQDDGKSCDRYTGNSSGAEPTKIGSGPDGTYCTVSGLTEDC